MNLKELNAMPRVEKVILYVLGTVDKFKKMGFSFHQSVQLSEQGKLAYQELIKQNFEPTELEIEQVVDYLRSNGQVEPSICNN